MGRSDLNENDVIKRHKVGIDCLSLEDDDGVVVSAEDDATARLMQLHLLKELKTEREKFIALALDYGFNKAEIADILGIDASRVTRWNQNMQLKLLIYDQRKGKARKR